jgi:hypothetical protein
MWKSGRVADGVGAATIPPLEPVERASRAWVTWLTLASTGMWAAFLGPLQVLLAEQADDLAPGNKTLVFGLVAGLGAAVSVVANPLFGA